MTPIDWPEIAEVMGWNAVVAAAEARREPDSESARVMRLVELVAAKMAQSPERAELQAEGKHPGPCAKFCEATAYEIELRRLRARVAAFGATPWFSVVAVNTGMPIEGCLYSDRARAEKRMRGLAAPERFRVAEVVVSVRGAA